MRPSAPGFGRHVIAPAALVLIMATVGACGHHGDGLVKGTVDLDITTTLGSEPCDVPQAAERALSQASVTATRATPSARQDVRAQLDRLMSTVPPSLVPSVTILRRAFDQVWSHPRSTADPFDTMAWADADQAILRYVQSGCRTPAS